MIRHYDIPFSCSGILVNTIHKNIRIHIEKMLDRKIVRQMHLQTISMIERVQEQVREDILLDEEPIEQQFEEEPSFPEEMELLPQEAKECALSLPMILTSSQSTHNLPKIHLFFLLFLIPTCGGIPYFVDYLDTQPPIPFILTCFVAGSPRFVDYATLHGMKPLFEHTECQAKDIKNQVLDGRQPIIKLLYFYFFLFWIFLNHKLSFSIVCLIYVLD